MGPGLRFWNLGLLRGWQVFRVLGFAISVKESWVKQWYLKPPLEQDLRAAACKTVPEPVLQGMQHVEFCAFTVQLKKKKETQCEELGLQTSG